MVSQWLMGEVIEVEVVDGAWLRGRGPGGYTGWTPAAPFRHAGYAASEWDEAATLRSLGASVAGAAGPTIERVPWGARLWPGAAGDLVVLPDGRSVSLAERDRVVDVTSGQRASGGSEALGGFGAPPAVVVDRAISLARRWIGVPYLWGGRTEMGVDCSGFVQAVYSIVDVSLPRDSHDQYEMDRGGALSFDDVETGDLIFFAPEGTRVTHVALSLGGTRIIHGASSNGAVREDDLAAPGDLTALLRRSIVGLTRPADR